MFDCVKALHVAKGHHLAYYALPTIGNNHVFINSPLGLLMDHLKGARKEESQSRLSDYEIPPRGRVKFDGRYSQLRTLIQLFRPRTFIEVGTWSGWRAVIMALEASRYADVIRYRGYDVFESGDSALDARKKKREAAFLCLTGPRPSDTMPICRSRLLVRTSRRRD